MTLAIVGCGLFSPFGLTSHEHVFFVRARLPGPLASPFLRADDSHIDVHFCPLIDVRSGSADRMNALAEGALSEALAPLAKVTLAPPMLFLSMAHVRPGLDERTHHNVMQAVVARLRASGAKLYWGEAGVFAAMADIDSYLERNGGPAVLLGVDSLVSVEWLTYQVLHPRGPWVSRPPTPSEGAGALVLMQQEEARIHGLPVLGTVFSSAVAKSAASDDNDNAADAVAMSHVLRSLGSFPVHAAFGQGVVNALRREEWFRAVARNAARFRQGCQHECIESSIGTVGAAAGAINLAYGLSAMRHAVLDLAGPLVDPFVVWAMSRDGTCGAAALKVKAS